MQVDTIDETRLPRPGFKSNIIISTSLFLSLAAINGDARLVQLLLEHKANLHKRDSEGRTSLMVSFSITYTNGII